MKLIVSILFFVFLLQSGSNAQTDPLWRGLFLFESTDHVNFDTLKNALHLNIVQGRTYGNPNDNELLNNIANLKVINQQVFLAWASQGQRMEYEAEQESSQLPKNYFAIHETGIAFLTPTDSSWICQINSVDQPGYMVKSAVPDGEYHYKSREWLATFRLKADFTEQDIPTTYVARCEVVDNGVTINQLIVTVGMFDGPGIYKDFVLPFVLDPPPDSGPLSSVPPANMDMPTVVHHVDLRVYWYGNHTTYLDKVIVEDVLGHDLFTHAYDNQIRQVASQYASNYPLQERFFLADEPRMSANLAFDYVGRLIRQELGTIPRAWSVTASNHGFVSRLSRQPGMNIAP